MKIDDFLDSCKITKIDRNHVWFGTRNTFSVVHSGFGARIIRVGMPSEMRLTVMGPDFGFNLSVLYAKTQACFDGDSRTTVYSYNRSVGHIAIITRSRANHHFMDTPEIPGAEIIGIDEIRSIVDRFLRSL